MTAPQTIGFIGIGAMGLPMATNLANAGFQVLAYDRGRSRPLPEGVSTVETPAAAAAAGIVVTMLPDDAALQSVSDGPDGVLAGLPNGGLHVSMSTISPSASAGLAARHADRDQHYLAATVFGRPDRAAEAKLWLVVAGPSESVTRATPLFEAVSQGQFRVGDMPESANVVKLAGNFLISSMLEALGETYALARKAGVSPTELLNVLNTAVFNSPAYESYGQQVAERRFTPGFKLRLALKDLRLLLETADARQTPMPLASLIHDQLLSGVARGMGDMDWSALTQVIADNAGD